MVQFIDTDIEQIRAEIKEHWEIISGRPLNPADIENLVLNVLAYREGLIRQLVNDTANQNLVSFSRSPVLDYLAELVGVERLAPSAASTPMLVNLVTGHTGVTVPQGTRIRSTDGKATFTLVEDVPVPIGTFSVTVDAICQQVGVTGNGYGIGTVNQVLDPQPYITGISNTAITAGGAAQEEDAAMRERIKLALSKSTTAGSRNSYKFYALGANANIIDVGVIGPNDTGVSFAVNPGEVYVLPLMNDGSVTPSQILTAVDNAVTPESVRPLTDTVFVQAPTQINYSLVVELIILSDGVAVDIQAATQAAIDAFAVSKRQKLGQDIIESKIKEEAHKASDKIYKVNLPGFTDIPVQLDQYAFCTGVTVNVVGVVNG